MVWMNDETREALSAMVDGELRSEACSRLLSLLDTDADLRRAWERFHLIGDAMRQDLPEVPLDALSTRTQEALRSEPVLIRPRPRLTIPLRPVAGLALAASVAVVAVLGVRTINSGPPGAEIASLTIASVPVSSSTVPTIDPAVRHQVTQIVIPSAVVLPSQDAWLGSIRWSNAPVAADPQLNAYLLNYNDVATSVAADYALPDWRVNWIPNGFRLHEWTYAPASRGGQIVEHRAYTDGVATFSVFFEALHGDIVPHRGLSSLGAVNAFGRVGDEFQLTVVGEVPRATVEQVASSITRN